MTEIPIDLSAGVDPVRVTVAIDTALAEAGLWVAMKGTLKQYPGCIHWHTKRGREAGTLEITFWPAASRAWFSIRRNRAAPWIPGMVEILQHQLQQAFR
jgi:hypothetical protein